MKSSVCRFYLNNRKKNKEYRLSLNTCTRPYLTESEHSYYVNKIKGSVRSSVLVPVFDMKHLKKAEGPIGWNFVNINMEMNIISERNYLASYQKFRKMILYHSLTFLKKFTMIFFFYICIFKEDFGIFAS